MHGHLPRRPDECGPRIVVSRSMTILRARSGEAPSGPRSCSHEAQLVTSSSSSSSVAFDAAGLSQLSGEHLGQLDPACTVGLGDLVGERLVTLGEADGDAPQGSDLLVQLRPQLGHRARPLFELLRVRTRPEVRRQDRSLLGGRRQEEGVEVGEVAEDRALGHARPERHLGCAREPPASLLAHDAEDRLDDRVAISRCPQAPPVAVGGFAARSCIRCWRRTHPFLRPALPAMTGCYRRRRRWCRDNAVLLPTYRRGCLLSGRPLVR